MLRLINFQFTNLLDATWTSQGDIVYTSGFNSIISVMSSYGVHKKYNKLGRPNYFGTSNKENTIYVTDSELGLYQSTDDGINWNRVVQLPFGWNLGQIVMLETNSNILQFWVIAFNATSNYTLRELSLIKHSKTNLTWKDIALPTFITTSLPNIWLAYDNANTMFISNLQQKTVHT